MRNLIAIVLVVLLNSDAYTQDPQSSLSTTYPKPTFAQKLKLDEAGLTRREKEVVQLAAKGYDDDEIANMLTISAFTVKFHLKRIFKKLGIHKRVELIVSLGK